jgi:predicted oxidoreductase
MLNGVDDPIFFALICTMKKRLIAGTMRWGSWGAKMNTSQYADAITKWMEYGVNEFDLANLYGDYSCEREFGLALKHREISRPSVKLISKMGIENPLTLRGNQVKHYNYSSSHILSCVEQSLRDLQTDYLDLLLLHRPSPLMEGEQIAEAISKLLIEGKIKSFGVSNFLPSQLDWLSKYIVVEHNQISFSLSDFSAMENGNMESYATRSFVISAYSPILNLENATGRFKGILQGLADKYECTPACIGVAWVLKHPAISSAVIGTSKLERISEIQKALEVKLTLQDYFLLWEAARGTRVP